MNPPNQVLKLITKINVTLRHRKELKDSEADLLGKLRDRLVEMYQSGRSDLACNGLAFLTANRMIRGVPGTFLSERGHTPSDPLP